MNDSSLLHATTLVGFLASQRTRFSRGVTLAILRCLVIAPCPWLFQIIIDEHVRSGDKTGILVISLTHLLQHRKPER